MNIKVDLNINKNNEMKFKLDVPLALTDMGGRQTAAVLALVGEHFHVQINREQEQGVEPELPTRRGVFDFTIKVGAQGEMVTTDFDRNFKAFPAGQQLAVKGMLTQHILACCSHFAKLAHESESQVVGG